MGNKSSKTKGTEVLPGVTLTPEAQAILNRQLSRSIVWRFWIGKALGILLGAAVIIGTVIFGLMVGGKLQDATTTIIMIALLMVPFGIGTAVLYAGLKA